MAVKARALRAAQKVVTDYFGTGPQRLKAHGGGLSNQVYSVEVGGGEYIVRLNPRPEKYEIFLKERWASECARKAGVPVACVLSVGATPQPHMIVRKAPGEPATSHDDPIGILKQLGEYAAVINGIATTGFGAKFSRTANRLAGHATWREFLDEEFELEKRIRTLGRHRMLPPQKLKKMDAVLRAAGGRDRRPAMNQGDLRLKNVLMNRKGRISAILDWENCISGLAPEWELSIALHDLTIDEKEAFLDGYGISPRQLAGMAQALKVLNVVNYVPHIERLAERDSGQLARYRRRLAGDLDLYSF